MNTWAIRAHGAFEATAQDTPAALRDAVRACMANPPRRINRYIRLALIGAHRCVGLLEQPLAAGTPLYMASAQGNVAEAVTLLDEIVCHGRSPKPMAFVRVSSNMAGFYLAASLSLNGRNISVARSPGSFGAMLELARLDPHLACEPDASMLLGSVTECVWPLAQHRLRWAVPADAPLVEASYWLTLGDDANTSGPRLSYDTATNEAEARAWLAAGERWAIDPQLPDAQRRALETGLDPHSAWRAPLCHRGHPDAVVHALFAALGTRPMPRLHLVAGDPPCGYQLMGVS